MNILHALVSYLAVTTLPFNPGSYAFAYPLAAIDYDGYVNATQNRCDVALIKRVPGDIIEARQVEPDVAIPGGPIILIVVGEIMLTMSYIGQDNPVRGNDAEFLILAQFD